MVNEYALTHYLRGERECINSLSHGGYGNIWFGVARLQSLTWVNVDSTPWHHICRHKGTMAMVQLFNWVSLKKGIWKRLQNVSHSSHVFMCKMHGEEIFNSLSTTLLRITITNRFSAQVARNPETVPKWFHCYEKTMPFKQLYIVMTTTWHGTNFYVALVISLLWGWPSLWTSNHPHTHVTSP